MVFHVPINGLGARLKDVWSGDRVAICDRVDDQSLGRSCDTFPGSHVHISRDSKVVKVSCDQTHDRSCDVFPGSHGWRVDSTTWLYFSLGAALGGLGFGILCVRDVTDSVLNSCHGPGFSLPFVWVVGGSCWYRMAPVPICKASTSSLNCLDGSGLTSTSVWVMA